MDLSQTLLQLEQRLLSQATRGSAEDISRLLADDFVEFGASGNIWSKADVVEQLPQELFTQRTISEFTAKRLSKYVVLVTYQCHTATNNSLRSSIWRMQGEQWQMVFHQGTFFCRSELAREKLPEHAVIQATRVIVNVHREQARSHRVSRRV